MAAARAGAPEDTLVLLEPQPCLLPPSIYGSAFPPGDAFPRDFQLVPKLRETVPTLGIRLVLKEACAVPTVSEGFREVFGVTPLAPSRSPGRW